MVTYFLRVLRAYKMSFGTNCGIVVMCCVCRSSLQTSSTPSTPRCHGLYTYKPKRPACVSYCDQAGRNLLPPCNLELQGQSGDSFVTDVFPIRLVTGKSCVMRHLLATVRADGTDTLVLVAQVRHVIQLTHMVPIALLI